MAVKRIKPNILSDRFDESRAFYKGVIGLEESEGLLFRLSGQIGARPLVAYSDLKRAWLEAGEKGCRKMARREDEGVVPFAQLLELS
jgi:hypothetical protein